MSAVIQRVVTIPTPKTEYLSKDDGLNSHWSENRKDAKFFKDRDEAEATAVRLRGLFCRDHVFIHAAVFETSPEQRASRLLKARRRRQRLKQLREELRQADLAELEQVEAYG